MKTKSTIMATALRMAIITVAFGGITHAQTPLDCSAGVDMGNSEAGIIFNLAPLTFADGTTFDWGTTPDIQGFVVPAGQLTGLGPDGNPINYEDLLPIKVTQLSIAAGAPGAAPTGVGTVIDGSGIETNALSILDSATSSPVPLTVDNGVLKVNGASGMPAKVVYGTKSNAAMSANQAIPYNPGDCSISLPPGSWIVNVSGFLPHCLSGVGNSSFVKFALVDSPTSIWWTEDAQHDHHIVGGSTTNGFPSAFAGTWLIKNNTTSTKTYYCIITEVVLATGASWLTGTGQFPVGTSWGESSFYAIKGDF